MSFPGVVRLGGCCHAMGEMAKNQGVIRAFAAIFSGYPNGSGRDVTILFQKGFDSCRVGA